MPVYIYLIAYLLFSSVITYLFSCSCGLAEPFPDRRKRDRRKTPREGSVDRRQAVNYRFRTEGYPSSFEPVTLPVTLKVQKATTIKAH